jgi:uncharacterized protein (DUF2141 family)
MKTALLIFSLLFSLQAEKLTNLRLTVSNIQNNKGSLSVAIYGKDGTFGELDGVIHEVQMAPKVGSVDTIISIPTGEYAIIVLHDENRNEKMDTGFMGMPKEGYGCSNNSMSFIGIPKLEKSLFLLTGDSASVSIELRN